MKRAIARQPHRESLDLVGILVGPVTKLPVDDNPIRTLKAGDTFYEPTGCLHRVSKNPSDKNRTRVLAVVLHPADVKDLVIPEKKK